VAQDDKFSYYEKLDADCSRFGFELIAKAGFKVAAGDDGDDLACARKLVRVEQRGRRA
jgi:hypothetical protein